MANEKKKKKTFQKPPRLLYSAAFLLMKLVYRVRYGVTVDRSGVADLKGPALVLAPHISGKDHVLVGLALYPERPTFVLSEHFMAIRPLRPILKMMHVITKKMFCADVSTIMNILRAKRAGNVIVLFPEGRLTWYGHSGAVTPGTADLVKKLGVNVYCVTSNGAYLTFPKWGKSKRRGGKIRIETSKIMEGAEAAALSVEAIEKRIADAIRHDEETAMPGVRYRCKDTTAGLTDILYRCPVCKKENTLEAGGGHIRCTSCGMDAVLDEYYKLTGCPFEGINAWYDWQASEIDVSSTVLEGKVRLGAVNEKGNMDASAGEGTIRYDREAMTVSGVLFGEPFDASVPSDKIAALPITVGVHFDVYIGGRLLYVYPEDRRDVIRYVALCDRIKEMAGASCKTPPDPQKP